MRATVSYAGMKLIRPELLAQCRDPVVLLALGFGSGVMKRAPGTFGTLAGLPFLWLLSALSPLQAALVILATAVVGVWICGHASRILQLDDPGCVVWDEMVGLWITLWALPLTGTSLVAGFLLFRLFDIAKPWPISWFDRNLKGGLGIMVDDLVAGLFAALLLRLLLVWLGEIPEWFFVLPGY